MTLSPEIRALVQSASAKHQEQRGIIPLQAARIEARDAMIYHAAKMISEAVTGPAISAYDLAERIVDEVLGMDAEWNE
jgi:hypothetical protein